MEKPKNQTLSGEGFEMKIALIFPVLLILLSLNVYGSEPVFNPRKVSLFLDGISLHSAAPEMNERHRNLGVCIDWACYMEFTNSFNDPGYAWFFNFDFHKEEYTVAGLRVGLIYGYEDSPLPFFMPFVGLGYKYLWVESTYIPSPAGDGEYLMITLLRARFEF